MPNTMAGFTAVREIEIVPGILYNGIGVLPPFGSTSLEAFLGSLVAQGYGHFFQVMTNVLYRDVILEKGEAPSRGKMAACMAFVKW